MYKLIKIYFTIAALLMIPAMIVCSDYNGNRLSPSKIIFNNNTQNSYIQSAMQKTVNFDGLIDQTFGNLGSMYLLNPIAFGSEVDQCQSIAIQADGKIVMGGYTYLNGTGYRFAAARLNADGSPDSTFGDNGSMYLDVIAPGSQNDRCNSIALQADGKIVMGGFTNLNGTGYRFAAARLNTDGSPDLSFGSNGSMYLDAIAPGSNNDQCNSIALQADGKIVMGGFTNLNGTGYRFAAARLTTDGTPDLSFGNLGSIYLNSIDSDSDSDVCESIVLQADGKIVMGGYIHLAGTGYRFAAARLNTDGSPDLSFGNNGSMYLLNPIAFGSQYDQCNSIALQADGKIVMGGDINDNNDYRFAAARLNTDGSPDLSFGNLGSIYLNSIDSGDPGSVEDKCQSITLQTDGKIVMGGFTKLAGAGYRFAAARLNADGSYDLSFGSNGSMYLEPIACSAIDKCQSIALQADGKIVMGGFTDRNSFSYRFAAARLINPMTLQSYQASYTSVGAGIYS